MRIFHFYEMAGQKYTAYLSFFFSFKLYALDIAINSLQECLERLNAVIWIRFLTLTFIKKNGFKIFTRF